ncbi:MAG: hypothetical protein CMN29_01440 [Sandaracinus sp.]|nr:hypothetical protein [Sandaracinus sp.]
MIGLALLAGLSSCSVERGSLRPRPMPRDAGQDAGAADASTGDASMDAGAPDAAPDAGTDAGIDAAADAGIGVACAEGAGPRVRWDFESPRPREDSAGRAPALDLSWAPDLPMGDFGMGRAQLDGGRLEASLEASHALGEALLAAGSYSVEVWLASEGADQTGPARIVTCSTDAFRRAFTIAQDGDGLLYRIRTTATNENGTTRAGSVGGVFPTDGWVHAVLVWDGALGRASLHLGGAEATADTHPGEPAALEWAIDGDGERCGLGAEFGEPSEPRAWQGEVALATIWDRALQRRDRLPRSRRARPAPRLTTGAPQPGSRAAASRTFAALSHEITGLFGLRGAGLALA